MSHRDLETLPALGAADLANEMSGVELGDERRNARLMQLMHTLASSPASSFASMCESESELEALYRLMRNDHVQWDDIVAPHIDKTVHRATEAKEVLVVHDTSTFRVADDADLPSYINTGKKGFLAHVALVLDGREDRMPLGVAGMELLFRNKRRARTRTNGRAMSGAETAKLKNKEFSRWWRLVQRTESKLQDVKTVHVMDREADSYALLSQLQDAQCSFVIRWCKDRNAKVHDDDSNNWNRISELLEQATETTVQRQVHIRKRRAKTAPASAKAAPSRDSRMASVRFARCTLTLKKPRYLPKSEGHPETLTVNVVHVYEPAPPEGQDPIEWVLMTNLSVDDAGDVERVVDVYRQRWLIEEFFKAIKTGCGYRKRRLTNPQSIVNTLATFVPIAYKALVLRQMAQVASFPVHRALEPIEIEVLRAKANKMAKPLGAHPTAQDALAIIARMGGHRKSSGPPGWSTLMKGMQKFLTLVEGWTLAHAEM